MKTATLWRPKDSGTTTEVSGAILTQASDNLVTQAGDRLVITESLVAGKLAVSWDVSAKGTTAWKPGDSGTTTTDNAGVIRTTSTGDTRITESGDIRVLNESIVSGKTPTEWTDN